MGMEFSQMITNVSTYKIPIIIIINLIGTLNY